MDSAILCGGDNLSIIKPIAQLLGYILDILFMGLNAIGIGNIAIAIIIFTLRGAGGGGGGGGGGGDHYFFSAC